MCNIMMQRTANENAACLRRGKTSLFPSDGLLTKSYNARAQLLFCSLNLLFSDVAVAVAVVVFLNSLI